MLSLGAMLEIFLLLQSLGRVLLRATSDARETKKKRGLFRVAAQEAPNQAESLAHHHESLIMPCIGKNRNGGIPGGWGETDSEEWTDSDTDEEDFLPLRGGTEKDGDAHRAQSPVG